MNITYVLVIEDGKRIVREFKNAITVIEIIKKIFGTNKAENFKAWLSKATINSTYTDDYFYIHYITY